ncbi:MULTISPECIES: hypothetical protein [unclassified Legionella]|uniref:hypothetical protein n=1 Tax=unclassified Legionella TaxID=2622702 RepID=UPI001055473D|nr:MULTISPECIES: hypothetical protein [unclassified Legionella]MDI9818041.1 hypothetical protein [Legionella sp. PL877]
MRSIYHHVDYRSMPPTSRFGFFSRPLHNEACYTAEELQFRIRVLSARAVSGLDPELLETANSWFLPQLDAALENVNQNSWIFYPEYKPKQELTEDNFHIDLINNERLSWQELSTLTRVIGDYLILRNRHLSASHLNQPINYVLLDVVRMVKHLSMIENAEYVGKQLQLLQNYLRAVEIFTPPTVGSDRLFLADCRMAIEKHQQAIEHKIDSQQLKVRILRVKQQLNHVAELRHTVLHFALADKLVNPHPYWEKFASEQQSESRSDFPTLAAKACGRLSVSDVVQAKSGKFATLELSAEILATCEQFKFVDQLPEEVRTAYSNSLVDLQEILSFQEILEQLVQLFEQAGEVFTLIQFREQMLQLLKSIEGFIHHSQQNVIEVLEANARRYHQSIQDKQDLRWWEKLLTNKQVQIDNFIINQDNLARFKATPADLHLAGKELLQQINQVTTHLSQQVNEARQLALVSATQELVQQLMDSMHAWIGRQHQFKGLAIPEPILLEISDEPVKESRNLHEEVDDFTRRATPVSQLAPSLQFWSSSSLTSAPEMPSALPSGHCNTSSSRLHAVDDSAATANGGLMLGLVIMLPLAILALKLLYDAWHKPDTATEDKDDNDQKKFEALQIQVADLLSIANSQANDLQDKYWQDSVAFIAEELQALQKAAENGQYNTKAMEALFSELETLFRDMLTQKLAGRKFRSTRPTDNPLRL